MKRFFCFLLVLTMCGTVATFGQLRVSNNSGQDVNLTVNNGQKVLVPFKTTKTFPARGKNVWLEAVTLNGKKFSISKDVPRSGLITIEESDMTTIVTSSQSVSSAGLQQTIGAPGSTESNAIPVTANPNAISYGTNVSSAGPSSILRSSKPQNTTTVVNTTSNSVPNSLPVSVSTVKTVYSTPPISRGEKITFIYKGEDRFKIFSEIGRGLEFKGADTLNPEDNAKNAYDLQVTKNQDLIIGIGIKEGENQAIWRYAEIRKRINAWDNECYIFQKDIKKMSTAETKKLRIKLLAEGYKIFFEPENGDPISIGFREKSRPIDVPVGQFYIRVSYTYPNGMFHQTVFVAKHVTDDLYLEITKADLDNAIQLNW